MLYSSQNGCFYYYDSVLFRWNIAEPSLLFLLGLEAVTSYSKSQSDVLTLSKYVYFTNTDKLEPLEYIEEIYDSIYSFLSKLGSVEDFEHYLKFNCYGLKLLLNSMTGTGNDRTVPIIFKTDSNKSLADPTKTSVRLSESDISRMSYYDLQAQKIYDIFTDADYDNLCKRYSRDGKTILADYFIDKESEEISNWLDATKEVQHFVEDEEDIGSDSGSDSGSGNGEGSGSGEGSDEEVERDYYTTIEYVLGNQRRLIRKDINAYNAEVNVLHSERLSNSEIYRLLDYKAMYSYALGVLYGCRCIGYNDSLIWRVDPKYWYKDSLMNLVRTAWYVFHFHWAHPIDDVTDKQNQEDDEDYAEKYKGIQENKIWNFINEGDDSLIKAPIASDELNCYCMYVTNTYDSDSEDRYVVSQKSTSESIFYSFKTDLNTETQTYNNPGAYLKPKLKNINTGDLEWVWRSIDEKVSNNDPEKGVVPSNKTPMTRYIGNDPVTIYQAYSWDEKVDSTYVTKYLAPTYDYYIYEDSEVIIPDESDQPSEPEDSVDNDTTFYTEQYTVLDDDNSSLEENNEEDDSNSTEDPIDGGSDDQSDLEPSDEDNTEGILIESGRYKKYFIPTGNLGWVDYNENVLIDTRHSGEHKHNYLYVVPKNVSFDDLDYAVLKNPSSDVPSVVTYYKCYVTDKVSIQSDNGENQRDSVILYGIYNRYLANNSVIPDHFDYIISGTLFGGTYNPVNTSPDSNGYSAVTYYDLSTKLSLIVHSIDGVDYVWTGNDKVDEKSVFYYGYSKTPSVLVPLYYRRYYNDEFPAKVELRYNSSYNKYWSDSYYEPSTMNHQWQTLDDTHENNYRTLYCTANKITDIYKCETRIADDIQVYYNYYDKATSSSIANLDEYVYYDVYYYSDDNIIDRNFIILGKYYPDPNDSSKMGTITENSMYLKGYTTHLCPAVTEDDNGNSLLDDENNPLVWYDSQYQLYWNGLFNINRWQKTKPSRDSLTMWQTDIQNMIPVFINEDQISIDGATPISLEEFYSDEHRGIIRMNLDVFNNPSEGIITCYCDHKGDPDHLENAIYCIPGKTNWVSRFEISAMNYWFVDGMTTLYSGAESENVVTDNDHID